MTIKNITLTFGLLALSVLPLRAQTTLTTTTLSNLVGASAGVSGTSCFNVASATGIVAPSFANPNLPTGNLTTLFVDKEAMQVYSVSGTYICALRGYASTVATAHNSGATVYVGSPYNFSFNEKAGYCLSTALVEIPVINVTTGHIFNCATTGTQWFMQQDGTQLSASHAVASAFGTGTVGSAETEYLNGTTASGATTATFQYVVSQPGVIGNLRFGVTTAVTGGTGKDVLTVYKNASATTITCTAAASAKTCSDTTHFVVVAPGDQLTFQFVTATSDAAVNPSASVSIY